MKLWKVKMNIAEKYFQNQLSSDEFRQSFLEEKVKLDIEYKLEELKRISEQTKAMSILLKRLIQ